MSDLHGIDVFNIVMGLGIVGLLLAIRDIHRSNKVLQEENLRERARDKELIPELGDKNEDRQVQKNGPGKLRHSGSHSV